MLFGSPLMMLEYNTHAGFYRITTNEIATSVKFEQNIFFMLSQIEYYSFIVLKSVLDNFVHITHVVFNVRLCRTESGLIGVEDPLYSYTKIESPLHFGAFKSLLRCVGDVVGCGGGHNACAPSSILLKGDMVAVVKMLLDYCLPRLTIGLLV